MLPIVAKWGDCEMWDVHRQGGVVTSALWKLLFHPEFTEQQVIDA